MDCSYSNLWKITLPIFSFLLIENIITFTDTAFLGRVNETQLAAASIGGLYYVCIFIIGFGFSIGAQILISHKNGENAFEKIGTIFLNSLYFLLIAAFIGFLLTFFFGEVIFAKMVDSESVLTEVLRYMRWRQFGLFAIFAVIAFRALYVGIADTKVMAYSSWLMGLVNLLLNYGLIFGQFGLPKMEIEGAALASTLSEFSALTLFIVYTLFKVDFKKYGINFSKISLPQIREVLSLSSWTMAQQFIYVAMWMLLFAFIEKFGQHELAQSNIIKSVLMFVYMPMYAFGATMNTVAGNLIGENREFEIPQICKRIIFLQYALTIPAIAILSIFPYEILSVYTDNPTILSGIRIPLYCALFTALCSIPTITVCNLLLAFEKVRAVFTMELSALFLYVAMLYFTVFVIESFSATWTLDAWYWLVMITLYIFYIKRKLAHKLCVPAGKK